MLNIFFLSWRASRLANLRTDVQWRNGLPSSNRIAPRSLSQACPHYYYLLLQTTLLYHCLGQMGWKWLHYEFLVFSFAMWWKSMDMFNCINHALWRSVGLVSMHNSFLDYRQLAKWSGVDFFNLQWIKIQGSRGFLTTSWSAVSISPLAWSLTVSQVSYLLPNIVESGMQYSLLVFVFEGLKYTTKPETILVSILPRWPLFALLIDRSLFT